MFFVCCWIACSFGLLLVVYGFFFCVFSFGLPFVLLCFLSVYPFLSLSRYVPYPFRSMACKKRRGTQVQIVSRIDSPPPARPARYRSDGRPRIISDIGRSRGRPSIPPEDRFGPLGSEPAWPSAAAFLLLDRYRFQMIRNGPSMVRLRYRSLKVHVISMNHMITNLVLDRYIGKWADPDIGSDKWSKIEPLASFQRFTVIWTI